ncbi:MAG: YkgJ family cysteine cluster protein [Deltaproteobacteria bacterium]|nr:YkgJ family cysteine cluster protein [Deltaproteobacteria bacterium]
MKDNIFNGQISGRKKIHTKDKIRFDCHPEVACFTRCCKDADMYLYPYDIIRMKNGLGMSSDRFLEQYSIQAFRDNPYFPSLMLKMSDDEEKSCPFLSPEGCTIYKDRPFSCRSYPLERAVARSGDENGRKVLYFIMRHSYCLGHKESREWTVNEWVEDQEVELYNEMNDLWVDVDSIFRANPWGDQGIDSPALKMAFMACFNIDMFKKFIFESSFLSRFDLPGERIEKFKRSDVELMKFGFDWTKFFLTGSGPLVLAGPET